MERSRDTITWEKWVKSTSIGESARKTRTTVLRYWAKANGKESPSGVLDDILLDKVTPYETAINLQDWLREKKLKPSVVALYRSMLPEFFESVLGVENFNQRTFDRLVEKGDNFVSTTKKAPTVDELKHLLRISDPRERALLSILCSGMRIGEALPRKIEDIEDKGDYARIRLVAQSTKTRKMRYVFLTKECVQWIRDSGARTGLIFPGGENDKPLTTVTGWKIITGLFARGGLQDTENEIYSPDSMRTFAQSMMRRCGHKADYRNDGRQTFFLE